MEWFNKFNLKERKGSLNCPNCNHPFDEKIIYFIEAYNCPTCGNEIWQVCVRPSAKYVYTIDLKRAPSVFKVILEHLVTKEKEEARYQLKELIRMFEV